MICQKGNNMEQQNNIHMLTSVLVINMFYKLLSKNE